MPSKFSSTTLPAKVDLRPYMSPVEDQGQVSCLGLGLGLELGVGVRGFGL